MRLLPNPVVWLVGSFTCKNLKNWTWTENLSSEIKQSVWSGALRIAAKNSFNTQNIYRYSTWINDDNFVMRVFML